MSTFSYSQFVESNNRRNNTANSQKEFTKVGYFRLKNSGDEALIRINTDDLTNLIFGLVHQFGADQKFMTVACLNHIGTYEDNCPLCRAFKEGNTSVGRASRRVYLQLQVAYKDPTTGSFSESIPVTWARGANFANELLQLMKDYGFTSLKDHVLKVTKLGTGLQTRYDVKYIPIYDKPELVSSDFSAFDNFDVNKHDIWVKTEEEMNTYLTTGKFPEIVRSNVHVVIAPIEQSKPAKVQVAQPTIQTEPQPIVQPEVKVEEKPAEQPATTRPARNFSGFSF